MKRQTDKGDEVEADEGLRQALIVLGQPTEVGRPSEAAFRHPPVRQKDKAAFGLRQLDHLQADIVPLSDRDHHLLGVAPIRKGQRDVLPAHLLGPLRHLRHLGALLLSSGHDQRGHLVTPLVHRQMHLRVALVCAHRSPHAVRSRASTAGRVCQRSWPRVGRPVRPPSTTGGAGHARWLRTSLRLVIAGSTDRRHPNGITKPDIHRMRSIC